MLGIPKSFGIHMSHDAVDGTNVVGDTNAAGATDVAGDGSLVVGDTFVAGGGKMVIPESFHLPECLRNLVLQ